jgi:hypothetical protein
MERANLKTRHRDVYEGLLRKYVAWNATMLPLDPSSSTGGFNGGQFADHFGVKPPAPNGEAR